MYVRIFLLYIAFGLFQITGVWIVNVVLYFCVNKYLDKVLPPKCINLILKLIISISQEEVVDTKT